MLINLEQKFAQYLSELIRDNHIDEEQIEDIAPDLYLEWLDTPQSWLEGVSPNAYYSQMDMVELIQNLGQYLMTDIPVPGPLLNSIADNREGTYPLLLSLLKNYTGEHEDKIRTVIVRLIEEMDMEHPYDYYIDVISRSSEKNDFAETCADALREAGEGYVGAVISAFESADNAYASDCFLDILTDLPYDDRTYGYAIERFLFCENEQKAFYASCLGKVGNPAALPVLEEALRAENLCYFDYVAIRNAFEALGGEVDIERDFSGDKDYESLINLEK